MKCNKKLMEKKTLKRIWWLDSAINNEGLRRHLNIDKDFFPVSVFFKKLKKSGLMQKDPTIFEYKKVRESLRVSDLFNELSE